MNSKKNTRQEAFFIMGFLFTLIVGFGTFLWGFQTGMNKIEAKYAYLKVVPPGQETAVSYQQQDLVSFYYVVFQPYQQFKEAYLSRLELLEQDATSSESSAYLKEIREIADRGYEQIAAQYITDSSPLLKEAQTDYMKSLKLFNQGAGAVKHKKGAALAAALKQNEFTVEAVNFGLEAQNKFYSSILKWTAKTNSRIPATFDYKANIPVQEWSKYPLAVKNKAVADMMQSEKRYEAYLPQDMTAKIDQMIKSGRAKALNLKTVSSIVKIVTETEAVKGDEFSRFKSSYYASELLPELPIFTEY